METEFKKLTEDEYRNFEAWIRENGKELYENNISTFSILIAAFVSSPSLSFNLIFLPLFVTLIELLLLLRFV